MTYTTTISKKGQITIPKALREFLELKGTPRIILEPDRKEKKRKVIKIELAPDFLEIAKNIKVKKIMDATKTREYMEKFYERV